MHGTHRSTAFTLIELLVVITIIVILLALLTPSLDKAIYQAELVVCAASQHTIAAGALNYAAGYRRYYPYRRGVFQNPGNWEAPMLRNNIPPPPFQGEDDRDVYEGHIALEAFNCPLAGDVDFSKAANPVEDDPKIVGSFSLYYSWQWDIEEGGKASLKMGDRLSWTETQGDGTTTRSVFNLLTADYDMQVRGDDWAIGSHPDKEGVMTQSVRINEGGEDAANDFVWGPFTWARWEDAGYDPERGPIDRNFLRPDGSVFRVVDNLWDDGDELRNGMVRVSQYATWQGDGDWAAYIPAN